METLVLERRLTLSDLEDGLTLDGSEHTIILDSEYKNWNGCCNCVQPQPGKCHC
ncbi:MAG: hypothetical protein ACYDBX_00490 [Patescibacteria group bacterium]